MKIPPVPDQKRTAGEPRPRWLIVRDRRRMDLDFVNRVSEVVNRHLADPQFTTISLAAEVGCSRMQLHRRVIAVTGISTRALVQRIRMRRARQLLDHTEEPIGTVARMVGFRSASYFSSLFKTTWGVSPIRCRRVDPRFFGS